MTISGLRAAIGAGRDHLQAGAASTFVLAGIALEKMSRDSDEQFIRQIEETYRRLEDDIRDWEEEVRSVAQKVGKSLREAERPPEPEEIKGLLEISDGWAEKAKDMARSNDRFITRIRKQSRTVRETSLKISQFLLEFADRFEDHRNEHVQFLCDVSDFYRGVARYYDPENARVATFEHGQYTADSP